MEVNAAWHERHRPRTLGDLALAPAARRRLESYVTRRELTDHLLFHGPAGTGKTTAAQIIIKAAGCSDVDVLSLNASKDRGIEVIRTRVEMFAKVWPLGDSRFKVVFLDEADGLTVEAQDALRGLMEKFSFQTKFVLTANTLSVLIDPLRSRCEKVLLNPPPVEERARVLANVLQKEGVNAQVAMVTAFAGQYSDMRELLRQAQNQVREVGMLRLSDDVTSSAGWGDVHANPVDGAALLDDLATQFSTYVKLPEGGLATLVGWTVFTHVHEAFGLSPMLAVVSPTMESGKSTVLDLLEFLCPGNRGQNLLHVAHLTPASIHHLGGMLGPNERPQEIPSLPMPPTAVLLADEVDAWMRAGSEIRAALDGSYSRAQAFKLLASGLFSTWYPKALALIERDTFQLPATIKSRSIIMPMRKVRKEEAGLKEFRSDRPHPELAELKRKAARWALDHFHELTEADPPMPAELGDRAKQSWRPLFAIAGLCGGHWPEIMQKACLTLTRRVGESREDAVELIIDIHAVFASDLSRPDRLPTQVLLAGLHAMADRPWSEMQLGVHKLSRMLRPFDIRPKPLWATRAAGEKGTRQGYFMSDFAEVFDVYVPVAVEA